MLRICCVENVLLLTIPLTICASSLQLSSIYVFYKLLQIRQVRVRPIEWLKILVSTYTRTSVVFSVYLFRHLFMIDTPAAHCQVANTIVTMLFITTLI